MTEVCSAALVKSGASLEYFHFMPQYTHITQTETVSVNTVALILTQPSPQHPVNTTLNTRGHSK